MQIIKRLVSCDAEKNQTSYVQLFNRLSLIMMTFVARTHITESYIINEFKHITLYQNDLSTSSVFL